MVASQSRGRLLIAAAMFDDLSKSLEKAWSLVKKDGRLTVDNIKEPIREVSGCLAVSGINYPPPWRCRRCL